MTGQDECGAFRYQYKPKPGGVVAATGTFLLGALFMGYVAATNRVGAIVNGVVNLDATSATALYWVMAVLLAGMVVVGLNAIRLSLVKTRCILLSPTTIEIPANWPGSQNTTVPFRAITRVEQQEVRSRRIVTIVSNSGRTRFLQRFFDDAECFEDCLKRLCHAVEAARQNDQPMTQEA